MKKIDPQIYINHPILILVFFILLVVVIFLPPRLKVRLWRKQKIEMDRWVSQKPILDSSIQNSCSLCGRTRVNQRVTRVLPQNMEASFFSVKEFGKISYVEYRCSRCSSEIGRTAKYVL